MFTGIIEEVGRIKGFARGAQTCVITIAADAVLEDIHVGDSIAVNGVCLTVTAFEGNAFSADVMNETLERSSLGILHAGNSVNLERAMPLNGRFGGHIVLGHIDGTGTITSIREDANALWYTISADQPTLIYVVEKGSIALDGISLTVAQVGQHDFSVSVIPHTRDVTNLAMKRVGDVVNIETDIIGKYVERLMSAGVSAQVPSQVSSTAGPSTVERLQTVSSGGVTEEFLLENGF